MEETVVVENERRSTFVTVLAWVFIVFSGFGTFVVLMQNIMFFIFFQRQREELNPAFAAFDVPLFFFPFVLLLALSTFISAIGLLKRKNWARIVFIVIMSLIILWNLFGLGLQFVLIDSSMIPAGGQELSEFQTMIYVIRAFTFVLVAIIVVLFAWIIRKLVSSEIRSEFT